MMTTLKYDKEFVESFNILSKNIKERRATAIKKFYEKYENCSENDEIIDLRTLKSVERPRRKNKHGSTTISGNAKGPKNPKIQTLWKAAPQTEQFGITEEDEKHLKIIRDKIRGRRRKNSGAVTKTSFFGSRLLKTKSRKTTSEADGLGKKQPSNETELHSKCTPKDKGSLLKPVKRINPIKLNLDQNILSKKRPSELHFKRSPTVTRSKEDKTAGDKGILLKPVRRINPIPVRKFDDSFDTIPIALECISPINRLTPVGLWNIPKRLPTNLDTIPIALECLSPLCHLTSVEQPDTSKPLRRSLFERENNSSLNAKLNKTPIHSKSIHSVSSCSRKSNSRSSRKFEH